METSYSADIFSPQRITRSFESINLDHPSEQYGGSSSSRQHVTPHRSSFRGPTCFQQSSNHHASPPQNSDAEGRGENYQRFSYVAFASPSHPTAHSEGRSRRDQPGDADITLRTSSSVARPQHENDQPSRQHIANLHQPMHQPPRVRTRDVLMQNLDESFKNVGNIAQGLVDFLSVGLLSPPEKIERRHAHGSIRQEVVDSPSSPCVVPNFDELIQEDAPQGYNPQRNSNPDRSPQSPPLSNSLWLTAPISRGRILEPKVDLVLRTSPTNQRLQHQHSFRERLQVTSTLKDKVYHLRKSLSNSAQYAVDQCETDFEDMVVKVRRGAHIVDDTLEAMGNWNVARWRQGVIVHFEGEVGIDCGALTREWAKLLCQQLLRPGRGLFRRTTKGNRVMLLADEESELAHGESMEGMYEFVGRFIGYSLWRGIRIDAVFIPLMFRMMKDSESRATFEDLKDVDFNLYSNLQTMLNCEPSLVEETFCQSFCIDTEFLGMRKTYDLCPDGASIPVTGDNVLSFLDLYVQHVLYIFSRRAIDSFLVGFHSLIPEKKLQDFSPQELEAVLCGQPTISDEDVEELRVASHCSLDENGAPHKQVLWFWSILARFSQEERSLVLQFVTGNERPPLTGFQALEHPFTVQLGSHMKPTDLPEAHVCFNQLVLPPAGSEEILREKLRIAVREGREGFELY